MESKAKIKSLLFAEFHPVQGPKVSYITPDHFPTSSTDSHGFDFETVSEYLIPKFELCNRLVSIYINDYHVLGYPVSIESPKYARNALLFNLCFIFRRESDARPFERVVAKTARVLRNLEVEFLRAINQLAD